MSTKSSEKPPNGGSIEPRRPLPAFEPINNHHERAESSASGSQRSRDGSKDRHKARDSLSSFLEHHSDHQPDETAGSQTFRRHSKRSSGGFLLGSIGRASKIPRTQSSLDKSGDDSKGKNKSEDSDLSVPKTRLGSINVRPSSSIGSSPLSKQVTPEIHQAKRRNGNSVSGNGAGPHETRPMSAITGTTGGHGAIGQHLEIKGRPTTSVGYDTDPSKIVNMALSLSEARRRQASARRYISADQTGRRIISTGTTGSGRGRPPSGSVAQYMSPQRSSSLRSSVIPRPSTSRSHMDTTSKAPEASEDVNMEDGAIVEDEDPEITEATAARVARARAYFELAYEHRRLLSHLPPVRRPGTQIRSVSPSDQSKAYNPLQYIRNRKLRIWDRSQIRGEQHGWHDVEKVRKWVDAVVSSHTETRHDSAECVRLPNLSEDPKMEGGDQDNSKDKNGTNQQEQHHKPSRPRSDWVTHPGDLIADCFWLEQGMNKVKILDRDNNHIYPPNTQFKFSGWRNRTPLEIPYSLQQPTPPPEDDKQPEHEDRELLHSPVPELPTFRAAPQNQRSDNPRKRNKFKDTIAGIDDGKRAVGLKIFMEDSDSSLSSHSSDEGDRGRKRLRKKHRMHIFDKSPFGEPVTQASTREGGTATTASNPSQPSSNQVSKRGSLDHSASHFGRFLKRDSGKPRDSTDGSKNHTDHSREQSVTKFPSFNDQPRASLDYDSTAPNSPAATKWPSIAINLESPPHSRSSSPSKRTKQSIFGALRDKSHKAEHISALDFAGEAQPGSRQTSGEADTQDESSAASRGQSPMTRGQSPLSKSKTQASTLDPASAGGEFESTPISRVSTRSAVPHSAEHGRIRGFFKGGRIAELVGNEVSKVGEFVWKRDIPPITKRKGSTSTSSVKSQRSDIEAEPLTNGGITKTPPRPAIRRTRSSTISSSRSEFSPVSSKSPPSGEKPKYNNPNLPSFTSPFQRDKEEQDRRQALLSPPNTAENEDHISRIAAEHRSASRSPRMDRLAPPRLDTGGSDTPNSLSRQTTLGLGLDLTKSREASDKFNSAIDGKVSPALQALGAAQSGLDLARISSRGVGSDDGPHTVTDRDISRIRGIYLTTAVKAREIGRRADTPRKSPEELLQAMTSPEGIQSMNVDLSVVRRRDEHVVAVRNIVRMLGKQTTDFENRLKHFSASVAPGLHMELQSLEDKVESQMAPKVRASADEAGELSTKLASTSTLAVKGLNDMVDRALRRRRRGPIRWVRRLWYASIEYAVVSLLWGIWAVVSIIRVFIAVLKGTTRGVRWLLWVD